MSRTVKKSGPKSLVLAAAAASAMLALPLCLVATDTYGQGKGQGQGQGQGGQGGVSGSGGAGGGTRGGTNIETRIFRGKGERVIIIIEEDDDSDRPAWAGGNTAENPHSRRPAPGTTGGGKGDLFGDLYYVVRDPLTGEPELVGEELQVCLDPGCNEVVVTVDGELPEGAEAAEVEFGRTNVMRAPQPVIDHSLDEVVTKLTAATVVTTDEAGRLVLDGVAIDSPLENLALYEALLTGNLSEALLAKLPSDVFAVAASALAGAADKTGDIDIDFIFNVNLITGVAEDYYDYSTFSYTRDYLATYPYYYLAADGVSVLRATLDINDYLDAVNGALPADGGITLFSAAADDSLEVIELVHTQVHPELLPGTLPTE